MVRTPSQIGRLAKKRGSEYELEIARNLFLELGIQFKRNLEQTRTANAGGDLLSDDDDFPFALELKRRRDGNMIPAGAWEQSILSSDVKAGIYPAVFYRYDHRDTRCVVPWSSIAEAETGNNTENILDKADISFSKFCKLAREIMAQRADGANN